MTTYKLTVDEFKVFNKKLDKLNAKGVKSNTAFISVDNLVETIELVKELVNGQEVYVQKIMYTFDLTNVNSVLGNFELIASLDNIDGKNVIKYLLGTDESLHAKALYDFQYKVECSHCGHNRKRLYTFVLQNKTTKEYIQVGRTCLGDFFNEDVSYLVQLAKISLDEIRKEVKESSERVESNYEPEFIAVETFVKATLKQIQTTGYIPSTEGNLATGYKVWSKLAYYGLNVEFIESLQEFEEEANKIIEWAKTLENNSHTYFRNLFVIASKGKVRKKHRNIASSMVSAYLKTLETPQSQKPKENVKFLGEDNSLFNVTAKLLGISTYENRYGTGNALFFATESGDKFTWFTSASILKYEAGKTYNLSGIVKNYNTYRNEYTGYVKNVKLLSELFV